MDFVWSDLKYAVRMMAGRPGFTAVAVITIALGIGANSAIFTVINAVVLRPLPFQDPGRIVVLSENNFSKGWNQFAVAPANLFRLLGVNPAIGRGFLPEEDSPGASAVVIISHALWQRRFAGIADISG